MIRLTLLTLLVVGMGTPRQAIAASEANLPIRPSYTSVMASNIVVTPDREAAAGRIIAKTRALNGWFLAHDENHLELRVPAHQAENLLDFAQSQGHQSNRSFSTHDYSQAWLSANASLEAKEGLWKDYTAIMDGAESESIFAVERAMNELRAEIEAAKGQLRKIEHDIKYARVTVYFQFPNRPEPARDAATSFPWVNRINLSDLLEDFRHVPD